MKKCPQILLVFIYFLIAGVVIGVDQLTKFWLYGKSFSLIGDFLWIQTSFNTGAAFSMLSGKTWFFILVAVLASALIIYLLISNKWGLNVGAKVGLALILGGAVGNLIDRIVLGGVRDFIYFKSINYAIFNFADTFVSIGAVVLVIFFIIGIVKSARKEIVKEDPKESSKNDQAKE